MKVSMIVPAFDAGETISRAINSCIIQNDFTHVIVVDDCSNDNTLEVLRLGDWGPRVTILRNSKNSGPGMSRNVGLAHALDSDFVGFVDADDFLQPGRVNALLSAIGDHEAVVDLPLFVNQFSEKLCDNLDIIGYPKPLDFNEYCAGNSPRNKSFDLGYLQPIFRTTFFVNSSLRFDESLRLGEDYDLMVKFYFKGGRMLVLPPKGYVIQLTNNSLSRTHSAMDLEKLKNCDAWLDVSTLPNSFDRRVLRDRRARVHRRMQLEYIREHWKARRFVAAARCLNTPDAIAAFSSYLAQQYVPRVFKNFARLFMELKERPVDGG